LETKRNNTLCQAMIERNANQSKKIDNAIAKIKTKYERRKITLNKFMEKVIDSGNFDKYEKIQKYLDEIDVAKR
jgi:hypothetical protein